MKYLLVILLLFSLSVEAGSMTRYLQGCNGNGFCDGAETYELCPDECSIGELPTNQETETSYEPVEISDESFEEIVEQETDFDNVQSFSKIIQREPSKVSSWWFVFFGSVIALIVAVLYLWTKYSKQILNRDKKTAVEENKKVKKEGAQKSVEQKDRFERPPRRSGI